MTNSTIPTTDNDNVVLIVRSSAPAAAGAAAPLPPPAGPFEEQVRFPWGGHDDTTTTLTKMTDQYARVREQVRAIFLAKEAGATDGTGFTLQELTVHLGVSAKGGIGFIAEAGVEASIELTFKRAGA